MRATPHRRTWGASRRRSPRRFSQTQCVELGACLVISVVVVVGLCAATFLAEHPAAPPSRAKRLGGNIARSPDVVDLPRAAAPAPPRPASFRAASDAAAKAEAAAAAARASAAQAAAAAKAEDHVAWRRGSVRAVAAERVGAWETAGAFPPFYDCLLYTSPSPRDKRQSRMPSSA